MASTFSHLYMMKNDNNFHPYLSMRDSSRCVQSEQVAIKLHLFLYLSSIILNNVPSNRIKAQGKKDI